MNETFATAEGKCVEIIDDYISAVTENSLLRRCWGRKMSEMQGREARTTRVQLDAAWTAGTGTFA